MLDIDQLLVPVCTAQVCGDDLSFSSELDSIVKARMHDDPSLEQGEWVVALKEADWAYVASQSAHLIQMRSKDLKLAVWLAEAHAKTRHFRGLGDGFVLLAGLCDKYWEHLHPLAEEGDHEQRIGNLFWLLSRTPALVKEMPLTEDGEICLADFEFARQRAAQMERQPGEPGWGAPRIETGPSVADLDARRRQNSPEFNDALFQDAQYSLASLRVLELAVDARLGTDGPSFGAAREALQNAIDFISLLAPSARVEMEAPAVTLEGAVPAARTGQAGPVYSRQQAIAQLRLVADYFRRSEPHSPVAYLADKAASWGEMSLHQWLQAVVKDPAQLAQFDELLNVEGERL